MSEFENETCEGCVWRLIPTGEVQPCHDCSRNYPPPPETPDRFKPSLECRQVRALEILAGHYMVECFNRDAEAEEDQCPETEEIRKMRGCDS